MLAPGHKDDGGGYAAAGSLLAPRRIRGPHLQPQGSLTRSLARRPTAALDPGASTAPNRRTARAGQRLPDSHAARTKRPKYKITLTEVSTVSGDCQGLKVQFDYGNAGIRRVTTLDFIASAESARVEDTPGSVPGRSISIGFDGWIFPRSGIAFVWVLEGEVKERDRRSNSGSQTDRVNA